MHIFHPFSCFCVGASAAINFFAFIHRSTCHRFVLFWRFFLILIRNCIICILCRSPFRTNDAHTHSYAEPYYHSISPCARSSIGMFYTEQRRFICHAKFCWPLEVCHGPTTTPTKSRGCSFCWRRDGNGSRQEQEK